jgi:hypothetical protein
VFRYFLPTDGNHTEASGFACFHIYKEVSRTLSAMFKMFRRLARFQSSGSPPMVQNEKNNEQKILHIRVLLRFISVHGWWNTSKKNYEGTVLVWYMRFEVCMADIHFRLLGIPPSDLEERNTNFILNFVRRVKHSFGGKLYVGILQSVTNAPIGPQISVPSTLKMESSESSETR